MKKLITSRLSGIALALLTLPASAIELPAGECPLIVASRATLPEVRAYINENISDHRYIVYKTQNDWYAISIGNLKPYEVDTVINDWKASGKIPQDSFCASANRMLYEVNWQGSDINQANMNTSTTNTAPDFQETLELAEQGDAIAQSNLATMYYTGQGVKQSYQNAAKWVRKAAEQGYAQAQYHLGLLYNNGEGVKKSYQNAVKWYRKAAEQGYASAQTNLGNRYNNGEGVKKSYPNAVKWYRKAAEQGDAQAQFNLGFMYDDGKGVKKSYQNAAKWYRKAAEQGHAKAQFNLGLIEGVKKNYILAYAWINEASANGHDTAPKVLQELEKMMSSEQVINAQATNPFDY